MNLKLLLRPTLLPFVRVRDHQSPSVRRDAGSSLKNQNTNRTAPPASAPLLIADTAGDS